MKEMVDIIKKINAIEELKNGKIEGLESIEDKNETNSNIDSKKALIELMQELDETKDVYRRKELTEKIENLKNKMLEIENTNKTESKTIRKEELVELVQELSETRDVYKRKELAEKIEESTKDIVEKLNEDLDKKVEEKTTELKKEIQPKVVKREQNKEELYRLKNNRDMLNIHKDNENPVWKETYDMIGKEMNYKLKENKELTREIESLEGRLNDLENRNFEKIIKEMEEEQKQTEPMPIETASQEPKQAEPTPVESQPQEPEQAEPTPVEPQPQEPEQAEPTPVEPQPQEPEQAEPTTVEPQPQEPEQAELQQTERNNKVIIHADRVEVKLPNTQIELDIDNVSDEEVQDVKALTKETWKKIKNVHKEGIYFDITVVRSLLRNEKQLNHYLDMCEAYNKKENNINKKEMENGFPEIVYDLKDIRKNKKLDMIHKMAMYNDAKNAQKMFKYYDMHDKVKVDISIADMAYLNLNKAYLRIKGFMQNIKLKAITAGENKTEVANNQVDNSTKNSLRDRIETYTAQMIQNDNSSKTKNNEEQEKEDKGQDK